ncbi:ATP-dependent DNA helicase PIF4 [Linum grandiflorum]
MANPKRRLTTNGASTSKKPKSSPQIVPIRNSRIDRRSRLLPLLQASNSHISTHITSQTTVHLDGTHSTASTYNPPFNLQANQPPSLLNQINPLLNTSYPFRQPYQPSPIETSPQPFNNAILDLGLPTNTCRYCGAYFWVHEALKKTRKTQNSEYTMCCQSGAVELPLLAQTPPLLNRLLDINSDTLSKHYRTHIRSYNAAFSWTSFGAKFDPRLLHSRGPYSLVLSGENYHYIGSLLPPEGCPPRYSQLYVHDPVSKVANRMSSVGGEAHHLNTSLMKSLQEMLDNFNVLAKSFRRVRDALQQPANHNLRLRIAGSRVERDRMYELPSGTELAGLIPGDFAPTQDDRDIIVNNKTTGLCRITSLNPLFDSLHFPMLFPYGNDGYHNRIRYNPAHRDPKGRVINPSSFTGGVRYMQQLYQDGMAICRYYKNPDLFITFTCNAQWPEIIHAFKEDVGVHGEDKPMVIARIFRMRLEQLKTRTDMHTVEFQKRGLPHVHIILWLADEYKPKTVFMVDKIISSELPDPLIDHVGYDAVTKFMIHGPCGDARPSSPCMKNSRCSKFFPKQFASETTFDANGYVTYRRRQTSITVEKSGTTLDNRYVVPYNRDLLVKYQAHINYLFKYITKGPDRSEVRNPNQPIDEISQYLDCRSLSSYEAVWRLFSFKIHERSTPVFRLCVHLADQHQVTFAEDQSLQSVVHRPDIEKTTLTEWFTLNRTYPSAKKLTYAEIPEKFVWDKQCSQWLPRKQGFVIGRIASVPPQANDVFYLRLLLTKIPGAMSFNDLRTVNGTLYNDYQQACQALGLLATDDEWNSLSHFHLPLPTNTPSLHQEDDLVSHHLAFDITQEQANYHRSRACLNEDQQKAHDVVFQSMQTNSGKLFFLYGHGGTGKTYLYNCIISRVRSLGQIAIVVASSGIAATLLPGGVTAHSQFKIPIEVDHASTCAIKKGTTLARLLQLATLIVWDEAPMVHKYSFEAVDRTLCDLMNTPTEGPDYKPFGEKTVLLGGDFRQTLPVITNGTRGDNIEASLTRSYLWHYCTLLQLHTNMRLARSETSLLCNFVGMQFHDMLLAVGDSRITSIPQPNSSTSD